MNATFFQFHENQCMQTPKNRGVTLFDSTLKRDRRNVESNNPSETLGNLSINTIIKKRRVLARESLDFPIFKPTFSCPVVYADELFEEEKRRVGVWKQSAKSRQERNKRFWSQTLKLEIDKVESTNRQETTPFVIENNSEQKTPVTFNQEMDLKPLPVQESVKNIVPPTILSKHKESENQPGQVSMEQIQPSIFSFGSTSSLRDNGLNDVQSNTRPLFDFGNMKPIEPVQPISVESTNPPNFWTRRLSISE